MKRSSCKNCITEHHARHFPAVKSNNSRSLSYTEEKYLKTAQNSRSIVYFSCQNYSQKLTSDVWRIAAVRMLLEVCCLKAAIALTQETTESGNYKNSVEKIKKKVQTWDEGYII